MKLTISLLFIFVLSLCVFGQLRPPPPPPKAKVVTPKPPDGWKILIFSLTDKNELETAFWAKMEDIAFNSDGTIKVWLRSNAFGEKYDGFVLDLFEFKCNEREVKINKTMKYDSKDNLISSDTFRDSTFDDVVPDSIGEQILVKTCSVANQKKTK